VKPGEGFGSMLKFKRSNAHARIGQNTDKFLFQQPPYPKGDSA
jgi:hypothetical protein